MKKRVISALLVFLILVPIFIIGGDLFNIAIFIISVLGLKEFINIKETKKDMPDFIKFISYVILAFLVFGLNNDNLLTITIDYRIIAGLLLVFLLPTVLYHNREKYSINDAFYLIGGVFFLGLSFRLMILYRSSGLGIIIYLFLITVLTDTYAYIIGSLIGKKKLLEEISPKKTVEGMIAGSLVSTVVSTVFYLSVIDSSKPIYLILLVTLFLSILGQFGDLFFSAIKRYYGKKDFSNIMPGHGGILDRFDSIIFAMLGFLFFITVI